MNKRSKKAKGAKGDLINMDKDKQIEDGFVDMLTMLRKKVQEKDEEIKRLHEENTRLKEKLSEIDPNLVLEETFKRR